MSFPTLLYELRTIRLLAELTPELLFGAVLIGLVLLHLRGGSVGSVASYFDRAMFNMNNSH